MDARDIIRQSVTRLWGCPVSPSTCRLLYFGVWGWPEGPSLQVCRLPRFHLQQSHLGLPGRGMPTNHLTGYASSTMWGCPNIEGRRDDEPWPSDIRGPPSPQVRTPGTTLQGDSLALSPAWMMESQMVVSKSTGTTVCFLLVHGKVQNGTSRQCAAGLLMLELSR